MYPIALLMILLGLLAACGQPDGPSAANSAPSSEPVPSTAEPTTPPATKVPTEPAISTVPPSTTLPTQEAVPTVQQGSSVPSTSPPLSTLAAAQPTAPPQTPGIVTFADQGRTIRLAAGETFKLQLDTLHTWTIQIADERLLERIADPNVEADVQAVYRARVPGQTTLEAIGEPKCRASNPPCMLPTIQFVVTILVR
jgi:hypothetical protein